LGAEGIALTADRALGWARLAATPCGERRIAVVLSDYPGAAGDGGQIGHAVGLDSFASLESILTLLAAHGYDERFRRIWTLYLAYCEAGFAERRICDVQLLLAKPQWAVEAGMGVGVRSTAVAATISATTSRRSWLASKTIC